MDLLHYQQIHPPYFQDENTPTISQPPTTFVSDGSNIEWIAISTGVLLIIIILVIRYCIIELGIT